LSAVSLATVGHFVGQYRLQSLTATSCHPPASVAQRHPPGRFSSLDNHQSTTDHLQMQTLRFQVSRSYLIPALIK
jgi:hypothetical protein